MPTAATPLLLYWFAFALAQVIVVAAGLALLKAGQPKDFPDFQFTTAVLNTNPRTGPNDPLGPNRVPFLQFKSTPSNITTAPFSADIAAFMGSGGAYLPTSNVTALPLPFTDWTGVTDPAGIISPLAGAPTRDLQAMSAWLLGDKLNYRESKYGAVAFTSAGTEFATQDPVRLPPGSADGVVTYTVLANSTFAHGAPTFMNIMNTGLLRWMRGDTAGTLSIAARNHPLPYTKRQATLLSSYFTFGAAVIIVLAFAFIPASWAIFVVKEREGVRGDGGPKHQQLISGVSIPAYWCSTWLFDNVSYLIPGGLAILMCVAFQVSDFTGADGHRINALILLFWLYGCSVSSFTYMIR